MNKLETIVYRIVAPTPWLKLLIRNIYQNIFDLLPLKKDFFNSTYDYKENYFFGFHDVNPFSLDNTKLLSNHLNFDLRMPVQGEELEVGYFEINNGELGEFHLLDVTYAWNYHKGCRLQWLPEGTVIYNTAIEGKLVSKIVDIANNKNNRIINFPIDTVFPDKELATSFSYERLEKCMPGYGYPYADSGFISQPIPEQTGLFLIDLKKNKSQLLVSIADLVKDLNIAEYVSGEYMHYVTHSEFSKDGQYVSFLHRWVGKDIRKRWTRVIIYDLSTSSFFVLPTKLSGSHYVWNDKNQLLLSCTYKNRPAHILFNVPNIDQYQVIAGEKLNSDGHQSFIDSDSFITDTYPDKYRMVNLYKVAIGTNEVERLAYLYSPQKYQTKDSHKHIACDVHPRVSSNGKYVCFDSPRTGKRGIYIMKL
jgi:hypothetical protein